jgi:UDP-sulfoquinovose synthase
MRILVLGADGYLGWPTALHLSAAGHDVIAADSLVRRRWDEECGTDSLVPIASMEQRVKRWGTESGRTVGWRPIDLREYEAVCALVTSTAPDAIVHFAEQRSAPYSMISPQHAVYTQTNNVVGTLNLLFAMRELAPDAHLIKLGTMGEYGTPNIDIEEGFIDIHHNGRTDRLPFPKQPGSMYHLSKVHDSNNIDFASRVWGLRATDLNQGVVYGVHTDETSTHVDLATRFDYDGIWGTVLNRFCVQAAIGEPLTVHGKGGQTRGFLDIRDTVRCIELAAVNPPDEGEYRVFNQFTEQFSVLGLAEKVRRARAEHGLDTVIEHIPNPRAEKDVHYYNAKHQHLLDLGLQPHALSDTLIDDIVGVVAAQTHRVRAHTLAAAVDWRRGGEMYGDGPAAQLVPAGAATGAPEPSSAR